MRPPRPRARSLRHRTPRPRGHPPDKGTGILLGQTWGWLAGIAIAVLGVITNFAFRPYFPVRSLVILAFNALVIWSLCVQLGREDVALRRDSTRFGRGTHRRTLAILASATTAALPGTA